MHLRSTIIEHARGLIASLDACSFDIFDTFLLRRCTAPDGVFELAARNLTTAGVIAASLEAFVQHRVQAEAKARREAAETRGTVEVDIHEIYAKFPLRLFDFTSEDIGRLIEAEFEAELQLCRVNPEMADLLAAMQTAGVATGFISDTYWPIERIARLLSNCHPGLRWDFLFASCAYRTGKADDLFRHYLTQQGVNPERALHIGDNERADIKGAERAQIQALHYPQASPPLRDVEHAEDFIVRSFCGQPHQSARLDGGMRTMRRALARGTSTGDARAFGRHVLGPAMRGFDRFLADRIKCLQHNDNAKAAIGFLGRDGMLPFRVWQALHDVPAQYVEINRRVSLIAAADTSETLSPLFKSIPAVDAEAVKAILKTQPSRIDAFFRQHGNVISGAQFAAALPTLLTPDDFASMAARMQNQLLTYLRVSIPDFDSCTDLVLVDLGYSATVQKALRKSFDLAGIGIRLHGLYLLSLDDAFGDIPDTDSAEGFISDLVVTPHGKRAILRNIAPIEQLCSAPTGSVRSYRDGAVVREPDPRSQQQLALCEDAQAGAIDFAERAAALTKQSQNDPFADEGAAAWCATILSRALFMPSPDELSLLSLAGHDINLGTQAMVPLVDAGAIRDIEFASDLATTFSVQEPPMWLGGSLAEQSPLHGVLYALFGAGLLPGAVITDRKAGRIEVALISGAQAQRAPVPVYESPGGQIRLRIPLLKALAISTIAIPIGSLGAQGRLLRVATQNGPTVAKALSDPQIADIPADRLSWIGVNHDGGQFHGADPDSAYLAVTLPTTDATATVVTFAFEGTAPAAAPPFSTQSDKPAAA